MKLAGPWIGEFGWELFCWQGYLRKIAQAGEEVAVACRPGHEFLYQDFACDILNYRPITKQTDMWKCHGDTVGLRFKGGGVICNDTYQDRWWTQNVFSSKDQKFISFRDHNPVSTGVDVLLIVRDTTKCNTAFRNWPYDHAKLFAHTLQQAGIAVGVVGTTNGALSVPGAVNFMDEPLDTLASIMSGSKLIVGPQCGPTHFATLCGLPQLCWQTRQEHADRMQHGWNPFNTPVRSLCSPDDSYWKTRKMWTPPLTDLVDETLKFIEVLKMK